MLCEEIPRCINLSLKQHLIFSDAHILMNYNLNIWKLTAGQWEWILHTPIITQRLVLQQRQVKFMTPITLWNEEQRKVDGLHNSRDGCTV